ncbi:Kelch repeat-containing protein [Alkalimonas mucilaginosa]|uniref:Galactose oxidase n=1 Tax=Alkalimonas mucilaginosa TaxID=3057676 RepID=A0ABU7JIV1_9GAMM|nr:galactose oxidase [Alkalimonas sp. MEB004]MEE2025632.1 galactose oxidase [Alkalimonas sp. MEB004]
MSMRSLPLLSLLVSGSVLALPPLPEPVSNNAVASTTVRGKTYVISMMGIGPEKNSQSLHNKVWVHTVGEFGWSSMPEVPSQTRLPGRVAASAVALNNNFFVFGGYSIDRQGNRNTSDEIYRFNPVTQRYNRVNPIPVPVDDTLALTYQDRYVYLVGGWSNDGAVNLVQVFDNFTQQWSQATPMPGKASYGLAGAIVSDHIVFCDGVSLSYQSGQRVKSTEPACYQGKINPRNALRIEWQPIPHPTGQPRFRMAAIDSTVDDEAVAVFIGGSSHFYHIDGVSEQGDKAEPEANVWLYSPAQQQWLAAKPTTAVMDLQGLVKVNDAIYSIGGMLAGQQVTPQVLQHSIERVK